MIESPVRRAASLAAFAAVCTIAAAGQTLPQRAADTNLADRIAAILTPPNVARDHWGIQVTTLEGITLYSLNAAQLFQPASNAKLFTTAAALALLGPNQRFTTRIQYDADGDKDTIEGDVVIVGDGDGSFNDSQSDRSSSHAEDDTHREPLPLRRLAEFANDIAASGIKHIKGNILGDDTAFPWEPYPSDWAHDDLLWGYGAPISALSVNDNQLQLTVTPGRSETDRPAVHWQDAMPPYYTLDATALQTGPSGSGPHIQIDRELGSKTIRVYGSIAIDAPADTQQIAIADPAEFAAVAFKSLLQARGIAVDGTASARHRSLTQAASFLTESMRPLPDLPNAISVADSSFLTGIVDCYNVCPKMFQHTSPTVQQDILATNKMSSNIHAELLLRHLGKQYGDCSQPAFTVTTSCAAEGARVIRQFLINAGIDGTQFVFFDGSGLSAHDLVTPQATAQLLSFAAHDPKTAEPQPWFAAWKASLPVGGVDGTLASRFSTPPLKNHIFAKTGTLGEARALSGYLVAASGRTIIFSIFVANHLPGTTEDREAMDEIVAAIQSTQ
ncbi:MAG TPA: D-alanyl-D-alanine carboxypeptidase/D-alanyl-D-alanine-endopeptidase [Acidobacteriaceae bacterium]|nr:D-alanyl-D-alanine carboxypeptidase/D-alanyl-D-alanine-endopeptidase [Acidobacteriaceae bacterium]